MIDDGIRDANGASVGRPRHVCRIRGGHGKAANHGPRLARKYANAVLAVAPLENRHVLAVGAERTPLAARKLWKLTGRERNERERVGDAKAAISQSVRRELVTRMRSTTLVLCTRARSWQMRQGGELE